MFLVLFVVTINVLTIINYNIDKFELLSLEMNLSNKITKCIFFTLSDSLTILLIPLIMFASMLVCGKKENK